MKLLPTWLGVCVSAFLGAAEGQEVWKLERAPQWRLQGFQEALDLSGIASIDGRHCLVGADELAGIQPGIMDRGKRLIRARPPVWLVPPQTGKKQIEVDVEAVAAAPADQCYYATGSHGVGKKKGDVQLARYHVFRIPYDGKRQAVAADGIRRASLLPWLEQSEELKPFLKRPLQDNGLNIEGLAFYQEKLWFGLRSPNVNGDGFVIEMDPGRLFGKGPLEGTVHRIPLGPGLGVREIVALRDGLLLLLGNAAAEASPAFPDTLAQGADERFSFQFWQPGKAPVQVAPLPAAEGKAEGALVLTENASEVEVLVLFDGAPQGGPMTLRLVRQE